MLSAILSLAVLLRAAENSPRDDASAASSANSTATPKADVAKPKYNSDDQSPPVARKIDLAHVDALTADELAARIDAHLAAAWKSANVAPAPPTTDSEFVRRIYLDLIGRIPSVAETLTFLDDTRATKRQLLVEELLQRGAWAAHFANTWRDLLLAGTNNPDLRAQTAALESWLRLRFAVNMPYDQLARELITAEVRAAQNTDPSEPSPAAFYQSAEFKPELLAASTSRVFLGIQLQCAQCHDHPFASWKRQQFWQFAAFLKDTQNESAEMASPVANVLALLQDSNSLKIPDTKIVVKPQFLDGSTPDFSSGQTKRTVLARWITDQSNPWFAEAAVNRLWDHFFGRGLVSPVDHLDTAGPPSQPELFDELSQQFILNGYDLKYIIRAITATDAYQRSSRQSAGIPSDQQLALFARMPLRRMSGDQLYASFVEATGFQAPAASNSPLADGSPRDDFQSRFNDSSVPRTDAPTTILQALSVMNGKYVAQATDPKQSRIFAAVADAPYLDTPGRVELLFLTALSRRPDDSERQTIAAYLGDANSKDQRAALADLFWSLLNSAEFVLNH
jgi:Protein of unknown function (DUF1549)/Protein of unknown function (DUF1553)